MKWRTLWVLAGCVAARASTFLGVAIAIKVSARGDEMWGAFFLGMSWIMWRIAMWDWSVVLRRERNLVEWWKLENVKVN